MGRIWDGVVSDIGANQLIDKANRLISLWAGVPNGGHMKATVTGATGFIGRHTVKALVEAGHQVTCLVRESSNREGLEELGVEFAVGDVLDSESLRGPIAEADVVFHLAALLKVPWRADFMSANEEGASNVARACAEAPVSPTLVVVSSLAAAGVQSGLAPRVEEDALAPVSRYGRAKLAAERAAMAFADRVPLSIVRPPMVFGEGDKGVLKLFRMAASGWFVTPTRRRDTRVSLVGAGDLAQLLLLVAEKGERVDGSGDPQQGIYYAAASETPSFPQLAKLLADATQSSPPTVLRAPAAMTFLAGAVSELAARVGSRSAALNLDKAREATAGSWVCSAEKARSTLGFRHRPLDEALCETGAWYKSEGWL
jgi:dihydroflavonol-4-reductase